MQFSMSSISVRTPERMQFGKRADHQPLRSTVKRTLKCGAGSFDPPSARCSSFPSELAMEMERVLRPDARLASSGLGSAWCEPSTVPHRLPFRWSRAVLHDVVAIERSGCTRRPALLERDPVADRVPRATNGKPCGANIKCPRCEGSLPRCEA
jgi:hypothetical protein